MTLQITIEMNGQGKWFATYQANVPSPAVGVGNTPMESMSQLATQINYENIPNE